MNPWQKCSDLRDAVPFYHSRGLYLKPVAHLHISVKLPQLKAQGKAISNWEIMEKLKQWIQPEEFVSLKVSKSTLEFIRFDGEIESKHKLPTVLSHIDGKSMKISGFSESLKIRAVEARSDFPSKYDWDSFFRDHKDMNEMKAGERPDTIYLANLPCKWFSYGNGDDKPSERLMKKMFEQFGEVARIDIPMLDPFRHQMNAHISGVKQFTFNQNVIFEAYIQFKEYFCFVKAMDAFRGMKFVHMDENKKAYAASIKVDFDKSMHLSDASVRRRQIVRERLQRKEKERLERELKEKEEEEKKKEAERIKKLERRKQREEKRKQRQIEKLKQKDVEDISEKIAVEEYLLLMAQRKLESIRLLGELINRVKNEKEKELSTNKEKKKTKHKASKEDVEDLVTKKNKASSLETEKDLRYKLIQRFKKMQKQQIAKETVKLKSLVTETSKHSETASANVSSVSPDTMSENENHHDDRFDRYRSNDYDGQYSAYNNRRSGRRFNSRNNRGRGDFHKNNPDDFSNSRGRFSRARRLAGRSQFSNSWRGVYPGQYMMPFMDPMLLSYSHEYYKYLQKIARDSKRSRHSSSRSYSRSRSRSYSRSRSRSYTRSYSRSYSRSRSRSRSRKRSYSRSRSRNRSRYSRSVSRRSRSVDKSKKTLEVEPPKSIENLKNIPEISETSNVENPPTNEDKSASTTSVKKHKKEKKKHKKKKKSKSDEKKEVPV